MAWMPDFIIEDGRHQLARFLGLAAFWTGTPRLAQLDFLLAETLARRSPHRPSLAARGGRLTTTSNACSNVAMMPLPLWLNTNEIVV
jgi:hypothetical protein